MFVQFSFWLLPQLTQIENYIFLSYSSCHEWYMLYGFYLDCIVLWQSSAVNVLVFSHRSMADVFCLPWESIKDVGCVVQACSDGKTGIRGAWSCRHSVHTQVIVDDHTGTIVVLDRQKKAWSRESSKAKEGMLSTWDTHWSLCVFILSEMICTADDMLTYFLYLFVPIHMVMAKW